MKYILTLLGFSCILFLVGCDVDIMELESKTLYTQEGCAYILDTNPAKSCTTFRFVKEHSKETCPKLDKR